MTIRHPVPLVLLLASCQGAGTLDLGGGGVVAREPLSLSVLTPTADTRFVGGDAVRVTGRVTPDDAVVWVEGRRVHVARDGAFAVDLPLRGPYRIVDIEAADGIDHLRETRTVIAGDDPLASWPGAVSVLVTPGGLARAIGDLGALVDELGWAAAVEGALPGLVLTHLPTEGTVTPTDDGLALAIAFQGVELSLDGLGVPVQLGFDRVDLGLSADLAIAEDGSVLLAVRDPVFALGDLSIQAFDIEIPALEDWLDGALDLLLAGFEAALDALVGTEIPVLPPIDLDLDLLGATVQTRLAQADVTADGVVLVLGVGIDGPPGDAGAVPIPRPDPWDPGADLRVGIHEGLFQLVLASDLLDLLDLSNLQLPGFLGGIIELPLRGLPGGAVLPDADGWCISVDPGEARVARLSEGLDPLAALYLPELSVDIGYSTATASCLPWLQATIATEVLLEVEDGTRIGIALAVTDGTVHYYGTTLDWDEDGVILGLGGVLETTLDLLGGTLAFDLADLAGGLGTTGGPLPTLDPAILSSEPMRDDTGRTVDGLHTLTVSLFR